MGSAPSVPDLADEDAALVVHSFDDGFPRLHLLVGVDAGCVRVAMRSLGDSRGLRDEKPAFRRALPVVDRGVRPRHMVV